MNLDNRTGMIQIGAQHLQMLDRRLHRHLGLDLGIFSHFFVFLGDCTFFQQLFRSFQLRLS